MFGEQDRNIPAALERYMADRAGARQTISIPDASHAVPVAYPEATAHLILEAAAAPHSNTNGFVPTDPMALDPLSPLEASHA